MVGVDESKICDHVFWVDVVNQLPKLPDKRLSLEFAAVLRVDKIQMLCLRLEDAHCLKVLSASGLHRLHRGTETAFLIVSREDRPCRRISAEDCNHNAI